MRYFFFFTLFTFVFNVSCASFANDWQNLQTGLDYKKMDITQDGQSYRMHVLKVSLQNFDLKPVIHTEPQTTQQLTNTNNAVATLNANFFDPEGKPLGLVIVDQEEKHAFKKISWWSIFCIKNKIPQIIHSSHYKHGQCDQAIEAGPRLLIDKTIPKLKEQISKKSAIGIDKNRNVYLIATENAMPITIFAQTLKASEKNGGLGLDAALNLDGGSSTQMYVQTENFELNLANFVRVPVGIGVFKK